jgi:hypothetical protein
MTADLSASEVAADLHLSQYTTTAYLREGRIPGGYQPVPRGRWLVDRAVYEQWKSDRRAAVDPFRIAPRSARSRAAQSRRKTA